MCDFEDRLQRAELTWPGCGTCRRPALGRTLLLPAPTASLTQAPAGPASAVTCLLLGLQARNASPRRVAALPHFITL